MKTNKEFSGFSRLAKAMHSYKNKIYYLLKPFIPRHLQIGIRRWLVQKKRLKYTNIWPIDEKAGKPLAEWSGWPYGKQFALVLTHDVDTAKGHDRCRNLMELETRMGFRSSFNFVPERYTVSAELRKDLTQNGFEVGVHGLYHDGNYYKSRKIFRDRAIKINYYLKEWKAVGFRTPSMLHNLEWLHDLNIEYDASTFDTDPFEPQPDGMGTIFPFWVSGQDGQTGYVELPYTLPQDFTLFVLMEHRNIDIWKRKLDWIVEHGGMALLNTHPDYMAFEGSPCDLEEYTSSFYSEFLHYVESAYKDAYWPVLPRDMASWLIEKGQS